MRKFAKISAVLAAMVLALAFAGCKSDDDDDDDSGSAIINPGSGVDGTGSQKAYWISEEKKDDGSYRYAHEYIEFTDATTLEVYKYYDEGDVAKGKSDKVGYVLDSKYTCKVDEDANCYTVTGGMFSCYEDGKWAIEDISDYLGKDFSIVYTVSGSEIIELSNEGNSTFTTKYIKTLTKPEREYTTGEKVKVEEVAVECWVSKKEEKDNGSVIYAKSYIEFTSDTTAKCYRYYDQDDVADGEAPSVGYFVDSYVTFKTNGNVLTATDSIFYKYEKGALVGENLNDSSDLTNWSLTYTISGSEMTEVFEYTSKGKTDSETTKYIKVTEKPTAPYKK